MTRYYGSDEDRWRWGGEERGGEWREREGRDAGRWGAPERSQERRYGGEQGGYDDERWRGEGGRSRAVMEGGDRGWPGGVRGAEGGTGYGRSLFGEAYALYAGRPEHEPGWRRGTERERSAYSGTVYRPEETPRRGRGPKGYRRSDERIREELCERIARAGVNADEVEVKVEQGEVTLSGTVEHRQDKRYLEDLCEGVFGVDDVHNQLRVARAEHRPTTDPGTTPH